MAAKICSLLIKKLNKYKSTQAIGGTIIKKKTDSGGGGVVVVVRKRK